MVLSLDSVFVMLRRWSMLILPLTVLIQEGISAEESTNTFNLRKCYCNEYQAWDGTRCIDAVTGIFIYIGDPDISKGNINIQNVASVNTTEVDGVTVKELQCPKHLSTTTFKNSIVLMRDERLLKLDTMRVFSKESYCIVNFWEAGHTYFDAQVCMPSPLVPRCCPPNHLIDHNGSCHPQKGLQAPPFQLGDRLVDWEKVGGDMVSPTCDEHEYFRQIKLHPGKAEVDVSSSQLVEFGWRPPFFVSSWSWRNNFCIAPQETDSGELQYVSQFCFKDYDHYLEHQCNGSLCIRKCCPDKSLIHNDVCVEALVEEENWRPSQIPGQEINEDWKIVFGETGCRTYYQKEEIKLLPNGFLEVEPENPPVPPSQYCLDNVLIHDDKFEQIVVLCYPEENTRCLWRDIVVKVLLALSCVFLMATLAVYLGVPDLRDHTYGRCLISMVASMLAAYITILCGPRATNNEAGCRAMAFITHLSSLAVFFWMNVMCFDMWKTLRGSLQQQHSVKVFAWYSLYAWGCPLVMSTITLILDITEPQNIILPEYMKGSCFFKKNEAYWAYFSGFILALVVINLVFFLHVATTLYKRIKQTSQHFDTNTSHTTNKTTKSKHQVYLFAKLFVVMGVVWITDSLSAVSHRRTCSYWVFSDIINGLQGVFIFIVAVCNKDKLKKVKNAWQPRIERMQRSLSVLPGHSKRRNTQNTLSVDDTEASRKTSITSLPRKISLVSNIFFSSKKTATLNPADSSNSDTNGRKNSNVSIKEVIPLSSTHTHD